MNAGFPQKLKMLMMQLNITSAQLARGLNVDPSLISRWLKQGCGERKAAEHAMAIEGYVLRRKLSPENRAWLTAETGGPLSPGIIAHWLEPRAVVLDEEDRSPLLVGSFHSAIEKQTQPTSQLLAVDGTEKIVTLLHGELTALPEGAVIDIFLSSEASSFAVDSRFLAELRAAVEEQKLVIRILVQSANNSSMASRLISACMPMLVQGQLTLSIIQGTPQTFTITTNIILPKRAAIIVTEAVQPHVTAVGTVVRDPSIVRDMQDSFENSLRFARPMMTAYDDSFARNIIEIFFEEYGVPGSLDVIKSGMNPMYMTVEQYGKVLREYHHPEDQYAWRYNEFERFKSAMDAVLQTSRFREVLSLSKLHEIAETGVCHMPSMYFMEAGTWNLDAQDCVNIFDGYIHYLETAPDFQVVLLEDEQLFSSNSCWHIKNNKHIMIHSWNIDEPMMVYSDQLMLIDEFQQHFDRLWQKTGAGSSKRQVIKMLTSLRDQCAEKIH